MGVDVAASVVVDAIDVLTAGILTAGVLTAVLLAAVFAAGNALVDLKPALAPTGALPLPVPLAIIAPSLYRYQNIQRRSSQVLDDSLEIRK